MTRLTAMVTVAAASAALATAAVGTGMLPASAAAHPTAHRVAYQAAHRVDRQIARSMPGARAGKNSLPVTASPVQINSQYGSGQYVSVVDCQSRQAPPPVRLQAPQTPLRLTGTVPSLAVARAMATRGRYKTVYTCTLVVKKEIPRTPGKGGGIRPCEHARTAKGKCRVTLNTGFGGAAGSVSGHRPRP